MATWQLQDAKAKLSEVVDTAMREGPQIITRREVEEVAVVPIDQWRQMNRKGKRRSSRQVRSAK